MNRPNRAVGLTAGAGLALAAALAASPELHAEQTASQTLHEGRMLARQSRLEAACERFDRVLAGQPSPDEAAFAHLMLGVVAHQRRDGDEAMRQYRIALEAASDAVRETARANVALLEDDRARFARFARRRDQLELWIVGELVLAAGAALLLWRVSRARATP